jgi:hypothetical protein
MENSNNTGTILAVYTAVVFLFFVYEVMTNTSKVSKVDVPNININEKQTFNPKISISDNSITQQDNIVRNRRNNRRINRNNRRINRNNNLSTTPPPPPPVNVNVSTSTSSSSSALMRNLLNSLSSNSTPPTVPSPTVTTPPTVPSPTVTTPPTVPSPTVTTPPTVPSVPPSRSQGVTTCTFTQGTVICNN